MSRRASRLPTLSTGARQPGLDLGDLPREARGHKRRRLPWPGVIERPREEDRNDVDPRGEHFLRELADAVRARRADRRLLVNRRRREAR